MVECFCILYLPQLIIVSAVDSLNVQFSGFEVGIISCLLDTLRNPSDVQYIFYKQIRFSNMQPEMGQGQSGLLPTQKNYKL